VFYDRLLQHFINALVIFDLEKKGKIQMEFSGLLELKRGMISDF